MIGLIILAGSLFNLVQGWLHARAVIARAQRTQAACGMLFVPAAVFVAVIPLIGIYLGLRLLCVRRRWPGTSADRCCLQPSPQSARRWRSI